MALVLLWLPTLLLLSIDSSQLIINTVTTIITFLMVALLENTTRRFEDATNEKLNALTEAVASLMERLDGVDEGEHPRELRDAEGSERPE